MELVEERRSKSKSIVEIANSMRRRISQNKPPTHSGAGKPAALESWL